MTGGEIEATQVWATDSLHPQFPSSQSTAPGLFVCTTFIETGSKLRGQMGPSMGKVLL
jgi:hypothetical protein